MLQVYGDKNSGNCLKVKYLCEVLCIPYQWNEIDVLKGQSRTPEFLERNPAGQVPVVQLADGRSLAQSNAILRYLARDSDLIPRDPFDAAKMDEWLFWEQYSHEPNIAVCRYQMKYLGKPASELDAGHVQRGYQALQRMETHLDSKCYFVGGQLSVADIALLAYTRLAEEGNFKLAPYPSVRCWIADVENALGLVR